MHQVRGRPVLVWRSRRPLLAISSAVSGGGIGTRSWVLNATVSYDYDDPQPRAHLDGLAAGLGLAGDGIGLLTAVDVADRVSAEDGGVRATVTTGAGQPVWAASSAPAPELRTPAEHAGTINAVCFSPVRLSEGALVNAVATVAEAKVQALLEAGVPGTGTVTDATAVLCPADGPVEDYAGPRSLIGSSLARAVRTAVSGGLRIGHPPELFGDPLITGR
nr:adenosylcobinamide amidohydrolase [Saccharopolyspora sp. HNM0983]